MFYSLTGKIIHTEPNVIVVECGGVGFKCTTTLNSLYKLQNKKEATIFTHLNVREDALDLFGFAETGELNCFKTLTSVSGVGPKVGIAILNELTPEKCAIAICSGDYKELTKANGVGPKLAQRIVLELKDKMKKMGVVTNSEVVMQDVMPQMNAVLTEAVSALVVLGYNQSEAQKAAREYSGEANVEDIIKFALKKLAKF